VLVEKIEQVVRLIRSKGVGIYFISQNPLDIPQDILGQLGLKIQHALRAFTPKDKKMISAVADTFRENPNINTKECITELGIGEALVSVLDKTRFNQATFFSNWPNDRRRASRTNQPLSIKRQI